MKLALKLVAGLVALVIATGAGIHFSGNTFNVILAMLKPHHSFDLTKKGPAPDYADRDSWVALPDLNSPADLSPKGVFARQEDAAVDVFFIHPTGYLRGDEWNWAIDPASGTDENTKWMLANQASVFNSCCDIYAPRYRQASIFAYFEGFDAQIAQQALDFAYRDVERAFDHFLASREPGRPFILAGHSQGTHHAATLLKKRIGGTPLRDQLVAAYIVGGWIRHEDIDEMEDIDACDGPTDLHCVNHWVTWGEAGASDEWHLMPGGSKVCTNPLTWKLDGGRAEATVSKGAVASVGFYHPDIFGEDRSYGLPFEPLGKPLTGYTWAECRDGALFVEEQSNGRLGQSILMPGLNNYHGYDYQLFHMDIRENAVERVEAYLQSRPSS